MDYRDDHQAQRIDQQMALATVYILRFIKASLFTADFCRLNTLAIKDCRRRRRLAPDALAQAFAQAVVDGFPSACHAPPPEIVIDALVVWKILRQHRPSDTAADQIEDGVEDFPHIERARSSTGFRFWDESFNMIPFPIGQVAWVSFLFHFPSLPD